MSKMPLPAVHFVGMTNENNGRGHLSTEFQDFVVGMAECNVSEPNLRDVEYVCFGILDLTYRL